MGKPPRSPYPPDPDDDAPPAPTALGGALVDTTVEGLDWANVRAPGLVVRRVELRRVRLTGAELAEASLTDVTFVECRLDLVGLRLAKLDRVVFRDCPMGECDLGGASLKDVLFDGCQLRQAVVAQARIERVELRGCDLAGLQGIEALRTARLPWADVVENAAVFALAAGIEILD